MRLLLALVIVLVALVPASAAASPLPTDRPVSGPRITASLSAAERFWHALPDCEGGARVYRAVLDGAIERVMHDDPCSIWIDDELLRDADWTARLDTCNAITHAIGHNLGRVYEDNPADLTHASDERSIMTPAITGKTTYPCYRRWVPSARAYRRAYGQRPQWATR